MVMKIDKQLKQILLQYKTISRSNTQKRKQKYYNLNLLFERKYLFIIVQSFVKKKKHLKF